MSSRVMLHAKLVETQITVSGKAIFTKAKKKTCKSALEYCSSHTDLGFSYER